MPSFSRCWALANMASRKSCLQLCAAGYASAWLKRHEPAIFLQALLNAQPMGFYSPSQLVQDARRHGVRVLPVDVCHSHWHCTLEEPLAPYAVWRNPSLRCAWA